MQSGLVVFDCDGVILESNAAKSDGFATVFADHPWAVERIVALHEAHGGISRYVKFEWIYRDILGLPLSPAESRRLGQAYTDAVLDRVLVAPEVPGLRPLLDSLRDAGVSLAVLSGTPQDELEHILSARGLSSYFDVVVGTPTSKPVALRAFAQTYSPVVFIGDAEADRLAAEAAQVAFLGRVATDEDDPFPPGTTTAPDLSQYRTVLHEMLNN